MSSLKTRLQNPDYTNWVKAGRCLMHTKSGLDDFADASSQLLHQSILADIIPALASAAQPVCGIVISEQKLTTTCTHQYCQGFLAALIINGMDPTHSYTVRHGNLANCNVGQWHKHHWQVAKLFMDHQRQQLPTQVNSSQTDMSGVLNFLYHCRVSRRKLTNVLLLDEVRKARNDIMADMNVSAAELQTYSKAMINLLNDPGISCFPAAQLAVAEIQALMKSAEFQITLEDEGKVMDQLAAAIRTMTEDIRYKVEAVAECGEVQRKAIIKEQLDNEIKKLSSCYAVLKGMVESSTESQKEMKDKITNLKDQLGKVTEDLRTFEINLFDIEGQLQNLAKQQETRQQTVDDHTTKIYATHQALDDLRTNFETSRIQTKQDIDDMKATHEVFQNQTNQKFDENTNAHISRIPTDAEDNDNSVSLTASSTATSPVNSHVSILARSPNQMSPVFANSGDQISHAVKSRVPAEILQMDNRAIEIYKKALEEGKEPNYSIRLMVTGPYGVGKSTFTRRLLCQEVDINDRTSTDSIDVHVKKCEVSLETSSWNMDYTGENTVQRLAKLLQNVDEKNTEEESPSKENGDNDSGRFQDTDEKIEESSSKAVNRICGDSAPKSSETHTNRNASNTDAKAVQNISWNMGNIDNVDDAQPSTDQTRMKHEELLRKDIKEVVLNSGAVTSDEDHADISVWDFGGQFVFYTTHQMFLSSRAIYILVNNMSQNIDDIVIDDEPYFDCSGSKSLKIEVCKALCRFRVPSLNESIGCHYEAKEPSSDSAHFEFTCSICNRQFRAKLAYTAITEHTQTPNIQELRWSFSETREDQTEAIFDAIRNRFAGKDVSSHFIDKDFGLSNAFIDPKLDELRQTILEVAKQQPYWGEIKPAKWIHLERLLEEKRREGVEILSNSEIMLLNQSLPVPIVGDEELELFLRFQHETANIMYFSVPELQSKIVLSPKFLVNALKSLITAEMFYKKKAEMLDKLMEFRRKGILKISLIDAVWNTEENRQYRENREHILALMEHLNIIARPVLHSEDDESHDRDNDYYLVPCMLKGPPPESILNVECQFISTSSVCLVLENAAFPSAIFNRLLVGCIAHWPVAKREKKFQIYCGCGQFDVDAQHRLTLAFHANVVSLRITKFGQIYRNPDVTICSTVYSSVKQILDRINKCLSLALKFEECIQCPGDTTNVVSCMHSIEKLQSCDEFPCHEHDHVAILHSSDLLKYWFNSEDSDHENHAGTVDGAPLNPSLDTCGVTNADNTSLDSIESGSDDAEALEDVDETDVIATGPITQEHMNQARLCNVIVTVCANVLRDILLSQVPIGYTSIYKALLGRKTMINQMRQIGAEQFKLIFPDPRFRYTGTVDQFDITLLYSLIRNISSCPAPATGWGKQPTDNPRDVTLSANVERVRLIRNRVSGHSVDGQLDEKACQDYFGEIGQILDDVEAVLGDQGYKAALDERRKQVITQHEAKVLRKQLQPLHHQLKEIVDKLLTL